MSCNGSGNGVESTFFIAQPDYPLFTLFILRNVVIDNLNNF